MKPGGMLAAVAALCVAVLMAACGASSPTAGNSSGGLSTPSPSMAEVNANGDIPDSGQVYVAFNYPSGAFTLDRVPAWSRADSGGVVTFTSHFDTVRLQSVPLASQPTIASVTAGEIPAIKQQGSNVVIGAVVTDTRTAGPVVIVKYQADSPADPVTGNSVRLDVQRYDFWHGGTEAVVTLAAPAGSDNVDPWLIITNSLHWS